MIYCPTNLIETTDSYKVSHHRQLPPGTSKIYSFWESRGGLFPDVTFFGLQYYIKKYLLGPAITKEDINEAEANFNMHFDQKDLMCRSGWDIILNEYNGNLPLRICSVLEGTTVPVSNVLMTVENLDPRLPWLTNYVETLLCMLWYPSTVATQSRHMKKVLRDYLEITGTLDGIDFKLHDFGFRGSTSVESAGIGGMAHLVNFKGTDTLQALRFAKYYYGEPMAGYSVAASEHSTITSWGKDHEADAYENILNEFPTGIVSVVSDSWDIYNACKNIWGDKLKDKVLARDGLLVVRPDSGEPTEVVPKILELLGNAYGTTTNEKGYKVLHPKVRIIQGDGIEYKTFGDVLWVMKEKGWSADNIVFGSGGGLLQKLNRDTQKFAFKCSAVEVNGQWRDVMKDPVTDPGKKSKAGRLALTPDHKTVRLEDKADRDDILFPVFENGKLLIDQSFESVRLRAMI